MFVTSFLVIPICTLNLYVASSEIKEVNNRFVPIYVFLAVFTAATGMANFKDLAAFFQIKTTILSSVPWLSVSRRLNDDS